MKPIPIEQVAAQAYRIPTDAPEADGTLSWDSTTIVVVHVTAAGRRAVGYCYGDQAAAALIRNKLGPLVTGRDALAITGCFDAMNRAVRNIGRPGLVAMAISALDAALWDLKARLFDCALLDLLGRARDRVAAYGSGGFTSYSISQLEQQLAGWVAQGLTRVKMKIGSQPAEDVGRVRAARAAIGADTELFVDANGAYDRKQALAKAAEFHDLGVSWFEEPVSSDDLDGLNLLRGRSPAGMEIAAGEYGDGINYFRRMLGAGAVDVLQIDATRCGGVTGFMRAGALAEGFEIPVSAHTAPSLHATLCCALTKARHVEYFHDHVRIESMLFDGAAIARNGWLEPERSRPGLGLTFKSGDAERFAI